VILTDLAPAHDWPQAGRLSPTYTTNLERLSRKLVTGDGKPAAQLLAHGSVGDGQVPVLLGLLDLPPRGARQVLGAGRDHDH
jgi:hypothetical protein